MELPIYSIVNGEEYLNLWFFLNRMYGLGFKCYQLNVFLHEKPFLGIIEYGGNARLDILQNRAFSIKSGKEGFFGCKLEKICLEVSGFCPSNL
jgi:hypothetical protein